MIEQLLIKPQCEDTRDIVSQCCVCKDFVAKDGSYITLNKDDIKEVYVKYVVSHGYCSPCFHEWLLR